jgi:hypothetical protein
MSAVAVRRSAAYVGFCGYCDTLNKGGSSREIFHNGLATNVGGSTSAKAGTSRGWHIVPAKGLPNRYITSIAIDPRDKKHLFVTLGGYTRKWLPAGAVGDVNKDVGTGHLFVSSDGGRTFRNVSGNLPDGPANWVTLRNKQLLVGTDVGAFASAPKGSRQRHPRFARLGGLPKAPVMSITLKPNNPNLAVLALFGRDVWTYSFDQKVAIPDQTGDPSVPPIETVVKSWDFELGAQGWAADGVPTTWVQGPPGHGSGTGSSATGSAFAISGPLGYLDAMDASLTSPAVTVPKGEAVLQWFMRLDTESYDPLAVEWSSNGTTWKPLATFAGKNDAAPGWSKYAVLLPSPGGALQVRFHFTSDELCSGLGGPLCASTTGWDGVHVDDVTIGRG